MIHVVIGTRAQLVKMGPILSLLEDRGTPFNLIFTGQHRATFDDIRGNFFAKEPDVVLYDGKDITSISAMLVWAVQILTKTMRRSSAVFRGDKDGIVLVHGDTFSCLLGALIAKAKGLKVGHIESGLRSHNVFHPFPEEITRLLTFCLADVYFCPGQWAVDNLRKFNGEKINTENNTLLDSLRYAIRQIDATEVEDPKEKYCVVSVHRFENVFRRTALARIISLIEDIASKIQVVFIMHPLTERKLNQYGFMQRLSSNANVSLRPRSDYFEFIELAYKSEFLVTDGGSNQEETFYMGKPCLLLRKATEREEGLGSNVVLSKLDPNVIDEFLKSYQQHRTKGAENAESPSRLICDYLSPYE